MDLLKGRAPADEDSPFGIVSVREGDSPIPLLKMPLHVVKKHTSQLILRPAWIGIDTYKPHCLDLVWYVGKQVMWPRYVNWNSYFEQYSLLVQCKEYLTVILECVAITNAMQPEAAWDKFDVAEPIHCRIIAFLLLIHYFTMWPWPLNLWSWPLTFDLKHLQRIACDMMKLCTKFERNRRIRCGVIAISVFDLITLNMFEVLRSALGFTKFDLRQLIRAWIIAFFDAETLRHTVTLTFDPLTLKFVVHQASRDQSL